MLVVDGIDPLTVICWRTSSRRLRPPSMHETVASVLEGCA
jgi:hypothetical protein